MLRPQSTAVTRPAVASAAAATILAASNRIGFIVHNDSGQDLYVKFGSTAASDSKSFKLAAGQIYESPGDLAYCGIITARMGGGTTGSVDVTEYFA